MTSPVYQYNFTDVQDYLHHRHPYLMVDSIQSIGDRSIETSTPVTGSEYFLAGHFPGSPIVPGAMLQEMTTQTAGILLAARFNPMEEFNTHDPFFNEYALGVHGFCAAFVAQRTQECSPGRTTFDSQGTVTLRRTESRNRRPQPETHRQFVSDAEPARPQADSGPPILTTPARSL